MTRHLSKPISMCGALAYIHETSHPRNTASFLYTYRMLFFSTMRASFHFLMLSPSMSHHDFLVRQTGGNSEPLKPIDGFKRLLQFCFRHSLGLFVHRKFKTTLVRCFSVGSSNACSVVLRDQERRFHPVPNEPWV